MRLERTNKMQIKERIKEEISMFFEITSMLALTCVTLYLVLAGYGALIASNLK